MLLVQGKPELFDDGVGEHLTGDPFDFSLGLFAGESSLQRELEVLSLAYALQSFVAHFLESALNGLALGIENAFLERDVNVGCHKKIIIREGLGDGAQTKDAGPLARGQNTHTQDMKAVVRR